MVRLRASVCAVLVAVSLTAAAQAPHESWRTVTTPHFRVHYPAASAAWSLRAAAQMESIRDRVVEVVGFAPPEVVDVVVMDPVARPNGIALPILGAPRLVLFTSPPPPQSVLGQYRDWTEVLLVHETAHLVHLLRPSRNPRQRLVAHLLPLSPITMRAPRWVFEGYATVVEGQLTGSGRPYSDLRAAILRRRAQQGELPTYGQLSSDPHSWYGMSMAYLAGSAFLEWLEERSGPDSLRHLWARMTARSDRSFAEAFEGVYGDPPARLYRRFSAELTHRAIEVEYRIAPGLREGELFQNLDWSTGAPQVSPDGSMLALVRRRRSRPSEIVVWPTEPGPQGRDRWQERVSRALAQDPEDVAPVPPRAFAIKPVYSLPTRDGAEPYSPRWMADGGSLLYVRFEPDGDGFLRPDLFQWQLQKGRVQRITRRADVRDPDPAPDGRWAVAVRHRHGLSQLVRVDLATGGVEALTKPTADEVCSSPRVSPDGRRVAYLRNSQGRWRLLVRGLANGAETELPLPERAVVALPAWSADGSELYVSLGGGGFVDVHAVSASGLGERRQVTRTHGGALAPAPTPDGAGLFFLALEADGLDLRRIELEAQPPGSVELGRELVPAVPPTLGTEPPLPQSGPVDTPRRYGLGRQAPGLLVGGRRAPSALELELGLRSSDVVGRLGLVAVGAYADKGGASGGGLAVAWRGWPVEVIGTVFADRERPSTQPRQVPGLGDALDLHRSGIELGVLWDRRWRSSRLDLAARALWSEVDPVSSPSYGERSVAVDGEIGRRHRRGRLSFSYALTGQAQLGWSPEQWQRLGGRFEFDLRYRGSGVEMSWDRRTSRDVLRDEERYSLGGMKTTIVPDSAHRSRVLAPELPVGSLVGDDAEVQRVGLSLGGLPVYYARHRLWQSGGSRGDWLRVVGIAYSWNREAMPVLGLPGFRLDVGVARILDDPFEGATEWWLGVAWRP